MGKRGHGARTQPEGPRLIAARRTRLRSSDLVSMHNPDWASGACRVDV